MKGAVGYLTSVRCGHLALRRSLARSSWGVTWNCLPSRPTPTPLTLERGFNSWHWWGFCGI